MDSRHNSLFDRDSWGISMKQKNTVVTLALVGVLALAAVAGGLLPSGNAVHAADPVFVTTPDPGSRSVPENTRPGVNIGDPISATDGDEDTMEFGQTLTYKLGGTDAASFDIDPSTGQLITKAPLDADTKDSYTVTVSVDDGESRQTPLTPQTVEITVDDVNELPAAPYPPTVVSGEDDNITDDNEVSTTSLKVVWHPPVITGDPITGYVVEYKKSTDTAFGTANVNQSGTDTNATITVLEADKSYDVRVRATNSADGDGVWSFVGRGSTNKEGNSPPPNRTMIHVPRGMWMRTSPRGRTSAAR